MQYSVTSMFIRGPVIRYVHLSKDDVNTNLLQEATRNECMKKNIPDSSA